MFRTSTSFESNVAECWTKNGLEAKPYDGECWIRRGLTQFDNYHLQLTRISYVVFNGICFMKRNNLSIFLHFLIINKLIREWRKIYQHCYTFRFHVSLRKLSLKCKWQMSKLRLKWTTEKICQWVLHWFNDLQSRLQLVQKYV